MFIRFSLVFLHFLTVLHFFQIKKNISGRNKDVNTVTEQSESKITKEKETSKNLVQDLNMPKLIDTVSTATSRSHSSVRNISTTFVVNVALVYIVFYFNDMACVFRKSHLLQFQVQKLTCQLICKLYTLLYLRLRLLVLRENPAPHL